MHILTINVGSYIHKDLLDTLTKLGHTFHDINYSFIKKSNGRNDICYKDKYHNEELEILLDTELLTDNYDCILSTDFYPAIGFSCYKHHIKYLAWSYDTPLNLDREEGFDLPTNYIFMFDREEVAKYRLKGYTSFYHMPLAVNCERLDTILPQKEMTSEITLMGNLYHSTLPELMQIMSDYQKGYLQGIFQAQFPLYGAYLIDNAITDSFTDSVNQYYLQQSPTAIQITAPQLRWSVATELAHTERIALLNILGKRHNVNLYTFEVTQRERELLNNVILHKAVEYYHDMPALFKSSKINLNPSLRVIQSGIPLRALDIIGSGGFLLSNFQSELAEHFINGQEIVLYESIEDAVEKAAFYLKNEDLRKQIAANGYARVKKDFRYEDRITEMLKIAKIIA